MFAQLLITLTLTILVAEVLCRILLRGSVITVAGEIFGPPKADEALSPDMADTSAPSRREALRKRLGERRQEAKALRSQVADRRRTARVAEDLAATEAEVARLAEELAELDGRHGVASSAS